LVNILYRLTRPSAGMTGQGPLPTRDEKATNLMTNFSMLFASMFEEVFAGLAAKMSEATLGMGAALADAMTQGLSSDANGRETARKSNEKVRAEVGPKVSSEVKQMFSGIREEISSKMPKNDPKFKAYLSNPAFDEGISIVERYDFRRPKLTERLSDEDLAAYVSLLKSGDESLGKMFKELGEWQQTLPKPPGEDSAEKT
jgi:hypothetical protein